MQIKDQPDPIINDSNASWDLVIADLDCYAGTADIKSLVKLDMQQRDEAGISRYGTRLQAHNGRIHLIDAYQELLDALVYLKNDMVENMAYDVYSIYGDTMQNAIRLRKILEKRDGK